MAIDVISSTGGSPEVQVLRRDVEVAFMELSKNVGQHIGQLLTILDAQKKAIEAMDARLDKLENKNNTDTPTNSVSPNAQSTPVPDIDYTHQGKEL